MTPQEISMINDLISKVQQTQLQEKDPDAEELLQQGLGQNPDSLYILAQTVLVQNLALQQARVQLDQLRQRATQPARATSFLGSLLGHSQPAATPPPPPSAYAPPQQPYPQPGYAPQYDPYSIGGPPMGQPSFLRSAAQTAAGVAAGALAFEGIESLLHGHGGAWGGGGMGYGSAPVEEVVNNYYGSDEPRLHEGGGEGFHEHREHDAAFDNSQTGDRDDARFHDANYQTPGDAGFANSQDDDFQDSGDLNAGGFDLDNGDISAGDDGGNFGGDDSNVV
jgi:hypothetical protein